VHRSDPPLLHHSGQTTTTTTPPLTVPCHLAHAGTHARAPRSTIALRTHNAATQGQPCSTSMAQTRQQGSRQENNKSSKSLRGVATRTAEISGVLARTTGATRPGKRAEIRDPRPPHRSPRSCCAAVMRPSLSPLVILCHLMSFLSLVPTTSSQSTRLARMAE
jgi:hypothetical protein